MFNNENEIKKAFYIPALANFIEWFCTWRTMKMEISQRDD